MIAVRKKKETSLFEIYDEIEKGGTPVTYTDYLMVFIGVCFSTALAVKCWL